MEIKKECLLKKIEIFSVFFVVLGSISLWAVDINSSQSHYNIIITQLAGKSLSAQNQTLLNSIPLLLKEEIQAVKMHHLSPEEISAIRHEAINKKLLEVYEELRSTKNKRDQQPYSSNSKTKSEYQSQIDGYLEEIKAIKAYPVEEIDVKDILPISLLSSQKAGELFKAPDFSPLTFSKENKGDLLITGSIEEIFGYFYLEIRIFDRLRSKLVFEYNNSGEVEDILAELSEIKTQMVPLVLGREYGHLRIVPSNAKAFVFLNDSFAGIGKTEIHYIEPGEYRIKIIQKGFENKELTVNLNSGDDIELTVDLNALDFGVVELVSEPSEAMVYENSRYVGITPLTIKKQDIANQILIKKEGYQDKSFPIDKDSPDVLNIPLINQGESLSDLQQKKRKDFYFAFGFFLSSLPVYYFLENFAKDNYNFAINNYMSQEEFEHFINVGNGYDLTKNGVFILSGCLLVNTLWQLYLYIESTNKLVE